MSSPTDDAAAALHDLEGTVREELDLAERGESEDGAFGVPLDEWLFDPVDTQREEIGLRSLLGAVEAVEAGPNGQVSRRAHP